MSHNIRLIFYTTAGCHLCEQAAVLLDELGRQYAITVDVVDIANDEALVDKYGLRIPVIVNVASGAESGWPFGYQDLVHLL